MLSLALTQTKDAARHGESFVCPELGWKRPYAQNQVAIASDSGSPG